MRTTVTLDSDVAAAVENARRERGIGISQALNELARAGLARPASRAPFRQRTAALGLTVDVANVEEALDVLEGPGRR